MYDWLVALVSYIVGDQILISLVVSSFIFQKTVIKNNPAQSRTHSCGVMTGSYIIKCAIVIAIHYDSVLIFQLNLGDM